MIDNGSKVLAQEKRILLIDDEWDVATLIEKFLLRKGYVVSAYTDPNLALSHLGIERDYDLVLSDIRMPEIDGFDVAKRAKKLNPKIKVLLMTSLLKHEWQTAFQSSNADGIIEKPVRLMHLPDMVEDFMSRSSQETGQKQVYLPPK